MPLPLACGVPDRDTGFVDDASCCAANDDNVAGEGTLRATSIDIGLGRANGMENVRARAAREGKEEEPDGVLVSGDDGGSTGI